VPALIVFSNKVLETMVDTNDEWITSRTGIKERRILKDTDKELFLAIKAAQDLIAKAIDPLEIDMVILASATPDMPVASTEFVATQIGATNAFAYDLQACVLVFIWYVNRTAYSPFRKI
jgi:3-oxoacyl-[acyl-carrier-protein] synthase-3